MVRIVIETDERGPDAAQLSIVPQGHGQSSPVPEAEDGGAAGDGVSFAASSSTSGEQDAGGPPDWLRDAIAKAEASADSGTAAGDASFGGEAADGGAGLTYASDHEES
ncbi:MAG TPA: hypothetical protein VEW25_01275 [Allosphingosinicella sp.]|nr:hypothetical protein [Allosphingosinicella sp.]